ncbi:PhzF family phenazine biosynthesis protein [Sphingomonas sp.]|uniref:PhzF family phenazine biosynthesis protein n=1 Tax=Sphingomonas sp. TaxID=28214 RepID=UPI00286DFD15|nr:PhzF family phenazine biosynthesis protein [Sphingomonas sp.]
MKTIPFFQVDAFATGPFTGNPAAVMPLDRWLDDATLQKIAAENNLSETAFTVPSDKPDADYDLRWFTPTVEVVLCGHASLASGHILIHGANAVRFSCLSGILTVTRAGDLLELDVPAFATEPDEVPGLLEALGVSGETYVGHGNDSAIVVLPDEAAVRAVRPDFARLAAIDHLVSVTAPGDEHDVASRVFAASYGIPEDPVTGAAHAALVPLWAKKLGRERFTALQASPRTGLLHCRLDGDRVVLGGHCVTVIEGHFQL